MKMGNDIKWECPKCKNTFDLQNQKHHCIPESISFYLEKSPQKVQKIFFSLTEKIKFFGIFDVEPANSSVQFKLNSVFLTTRFKEESLELEFQSEKPDLSIKPVHTVKIASSRYMHRIIVSNIKQLDDELIGILYNSYAIA